MCFVNTTDHTDKTNPGLFPLLSIDSSSKSGNDQGPRRGGVTVNGRLTGPEERAQQACGGSDPGAIPYEAGGQTR